VLVEDDIHDPLQLLELHRVQGAGHFDIGVTFAHDLEGKALRVKFVNLTWK
jgi:hypothetical protein